jgi:hypothetical protein
VSELDLCVERKRVLRTKIVNPMFMLHCFLLQQTGILLLLLLLLLLGNCLLFVTVRFAVCYVKFSYARYDNFNNNSYMLSGLSTLYGCTESLAIKLKVSFVIRVSKFLHSQEVPRLKTGKRVP